MKAIIMAGGEGTRLRPLTCDCPKPMLKLMGRPLMEYAVGLLKKHGIEDIAVTLGYLEGDVRAYFGDGSRFGVRLKYYIEKTPLGTAGSVRRAQDFLNERFIVLSGDGITDFDLRAAVELHQRRGAQATMLLKKCVDPQEYGMVRMGENDRVAGFVEKPGRYDVCSDLVNTGIYILEPQLLARIPPKGACDFGGMFFPDMLRDGLLLCGCEMQGYWCDVGDVNAYLRVHRDALDRKIALAGLAPAVRGEVGRGCTIEAPVFIEKGAKIENGARIRAYSVIGANCRVESGADVKKSILFEGAHVARGARLRGCILCRGAAAGEDAQLYEGAVLGSASAAGARSVLLPGVKLWPMKQLPDGERMDENIVWDALRQMRFEAGSLPISTPQQAARASKAAAAELGADEILLGRTASTVSEAMWHSAAAALMAQGVQVVDAGVCTLAQLRFWQNRLHTPAAMLAGADRITPLDAYSARLSERRQRSVLKIYERQDFGKAFAGITLPVRAAGDVDLAYIADRAALFRADRGKAPPLVLCAQQSHLLSLAERVFVRAGLKVRCEWNADALRLCTDEVGVVFSDRGEHFTLMDAHGRFDEVDMQLLLAWTAIENGADALILAPHATRAAAELAKARGVRVQYHADEPAVWMRRLAEDAPFSFMLQFDAVAGAVCALSALARAGLDTAAWKKRMPQAFRESGSVDLPARDTGRVLRHFAQAHPEAKPGGGLRIEETRGWVFIHPGEKAAQLFLTAEALKAETARELFDFYRNELETLIRKR